MAASSTGHSGKCIFNSNLLLKFEIYRTASRYCVNVVPQHNSEMYSIEYVDVIQDLFQELEKLGARKLRMSAKETMTTAEKLYTQGYISYPRTETNIFPKELNLTPLVEMQTQDPDWGGKNFMCLNRDLAAANTSEDKASKCFR